MAETVPYKPKPSEIPTAPGVYRFRDERDRVLYVGKAKNLRQRLSSYFQPLTALHERTRRMVLSATRVEWTIVATEFEALQLEFTWIKEYEPPFNIVFRDDKSYPYMAITLADEAPRVIVTRNRRIPGARYFGPYPKVWAVRETIDLMIKAFPIRTCADPRYKEAMETGRPCFAGQIGRCGGPCSMRVTVEEHRKMVAKFIEAMSGHDRQLARELEQQMQEASARLDFERAGVLRDRLRALEAVLAKSSIVLGDNVDADVFGSVHDGLSAAVHLFAVRGGRIRSTRSWVVDTELDVTDAELCSQMLRTSYEGEEVPPRTISVPVLPESQIEVENWLTQRRADAGLHGKVEVSVPRRGDRRKLQETAFANAAHALQVARTRRTSDYLTRTQALTDLQGALGLEEAPLRIECFDVSHLQGTNVVASMVVFEDGLPRKDQYRKFSIDETTDDTDSIRQVIGRRARYLAEPNQHEDQHDQQAGQERKSRFAYPPQLLLVDGGQPQVAAAKQALDAAGVGDIAVAGLAKRLEELWLPDSDYPVILPRSSEALYLVQRLRDEAHRFAISYQRRKRLSAIESELSAIPGLGEERTKRLLRHFGSAKRVRAAEPASLSEVRGIGPTLAEQIWNALHSGGDQRAESPMVSGS